MTILVDQAIWPWRGDRWAHLVSDSSIPELHEFSRSLRVRRLSFSGDHYDVTAAVRLRALELGAEPTDAREIVRRLRSAGLRRRARDHWQQLAEVPAAALVSQLVPLVSPASAGHVEIAAGSLLSAEPLSSARIAVRGDEVLAAVSTRYETAGRVEDRFELRVTPYEDHWFAEVAADRSAEAPLA